MMKTEITADEIVSLLHDMGYRASYEHEDGMRGVITSASQGFEWTIYLGDVLEDIPTEILRFRFTIFLNPFAYPVGKICNQYNWLHSFGSAHYPDGELVDEDGETAMTLGFTVSCTGGVSEDWLQDQILKWDTCLNDFRTTVIENMDMDIDDDSVF